MASMVWCVIVILAAGFDSMESLTIPDQRTFEKRKKQLELYGRYLDPSSGPQGRFFYDPYGPDWQRPLYYPRGFRFNGRAYNRARRIQEAPSFTFSGTALRPPFYGFYAGQVVRQNPIQAADQLLYRKSLQTTPAPPAGAAPGAPAPSPPIYRDCDLLYEQGMTGSGVGMLPLMGLRVEVYCEMNGLGNNWLVIQRRYADVEDFYRTWDEYEDGFGAKNDDHWLGLLPISDVCKFGPQTLRVELGEFGGATTVAEYSSFLVRDAATNYRLEVSGYDTSFDAGDALAYHNGFPFTTQDRDNDNHFFGANCAVENHGGWWYNSCYHANLNGEYLPMNSAMPQGIVWFPWRNNINSLQTTRMMIRPNY